MTETKGKRKADVSTLEDESAAKRPRLWKEGDQKFPPSAVPSLFAICRAEAVRALDAADPGERVSGAADLLRLFQNQEFQIAGRAEFVPEIVAVQRLYDLERIDKISGLADIALAECVAAAQHIDNDFNDALMTAEETKKEIFGALDDAMQDLENMSSQVHVARGVLTKTVDTFDDACSQYLHCENTPDDAWIAFDTATIDAKSLAALWLIRHDCKDPSTCDAPKPDGKCREASGCTAPTSNDLYACSAHHPLTEVWTRIVPGPETEFIRAKKDITSEFVLDVFVGPRFYGKPDGKHDKVVEVRPDVWINGKGRCRAALVRTADKSKHELGNARFDQHEGVVLLVSTVDIKKGQEIVLI